MSDLISRQAAIEHLKKRLYETAFNNPQIGYPYAEMAENRVGVWLGEVPSAQKTGKWVKAGQSFVNPNRFRNYWCSVCGYDIEKTKYNYCPNCGANMEVDNV